MSKGYNRLRAIGSINRRQFIKYGGLALGTNILAACAPNRKTASSTVKRYLEPATLDISWHAEPDYGGFYQALATDIYENHGLDVTLKAGGPNVNSSIFLLGGAVEFSLTGSSSAIKAVQEGLPKIKVAAIYQKDPQVLIAHPNMGNDSLEQLKGKPIMVSPHANLGYWPFLEAKYGFTSDKKRPHS